MFQIQLPYLIKDGCIRFNGYFPFFLKTQCLIDKLGTAVFTSVQGITVNAVPGSAAVTVAE